MTEDFDFFKSEVVQEELEAIQECYTELLKMSAGLKQFNPKERLEHIEKTLELVAKQKVFYARLQLAANELQDDDSAKEIKKRIEMMSTEYSGGLNLNMVLDQMEEKLRGWRADLKKDGVDKPK
jgi:hypothetical protein|tara:strand:- start:3 stop:374 length:372 start_codon:yes stop_codon:yes gene_type:complete